jgi:MFS family permease
MAFAIASHIYVMRTVMPDVVESLDTTIGYVQIILVYLTVVAAVFVPTSRTLAQILGARRLFVLGLLAFVAGILITATSSGVVTLMLGYSVISGLAISALVSVYWGWVTRHAGGCRGILGLYAQVGALIGPPIGGMIATRSGW